MPSTSPKQAKLMQTVAHSPQFAKKVGVPQKVGKEFNKLDMQKAQAKALRAPKQPKEPMEPDEPGGY